MKHPRLSVSAACLAIAIASLLLAGIASGQTETTLYYFQGRPDGADPAAEVVFDKVGNIYGTTQNGGQFGAGSVFELTPNGGTWTETILYSFTGGSDGQQPSSGLVLDSEGALYGTTIYGGYKITGTVFKLTPPTMQGDAWTETTIYEFCSTGTCTDGAWPSGTLVFDKKGNLYGTAENDGNAPCGCGVVFKLSPPHGRQTAWTETVLYNFLGHANGDGGLPQTGVIFDKSGNLYGTTPVGGHYHSACQNQGCGIVFKLASTGRGWKESRLYSFRGTGDGNVPEAGLVFDRSGNLYGTTSGAAVYNPGNVFKLRPPATGGGAWTERVLYSFRGVPDGFGPYAGVIFNANGHLFGTTTWGGSGGCSYGGSVVGCGTVFELTPPKDRKGPWTETILWNFADGEGGQLPSAALTLKSGALYGTTVDGGGGTGCQFYCGGVFELVP